MALSDNRSPGMYMGSNIHYSADNKPLCSYSQKLCKLRRKTGYAFCVRHILEDPNAPFRQCAYMVKSSKQKCTSAIPNSKEQEYCSAHMQVMGFMPKKERKIKVKTETSAEDTSSLTYLEKTLTNGHTNDKSASIGFVSPSKLYPELATQLSTDPSNNTTNGQIPSDSTAPGASTNNIASTKSPVKITTPKKRPKPTRKSASILRKKQLGLLREEQAKRLLTEPGLRAYKHYGEEVLHNADIITPLLESSDDETHSTSYLKLPPPVRFSNCNIKIGASHSYDLNNSAQHESNRTENEDTHGRLHKTHDSENASPQSNRSGLSRLKEDINSKHNETKDGLTEKTTSHDTRHASHPQYSNTAEHSNLELLTLKRQCNQLTSAKHIYQPAYAYTCKRAQLLIAAVKDNLLNAIQLVRQMRKAGTENCHHIQCYHTETAPELNETIVKSPIMTGDQTRVHCKFRSRMRPQKSSQVSIPVSCVHTENDTKCSQPSLPLSNYCIQHITYDTGQRLFRTCTHSDDGGMTCSKNTVDPIHSEALCPKHGRYEVDRPVDPGLVLKGPKKKKPKFALLRRKKRKNIIRPGSYKSSEAPPTVSTDLSAVQRVPAVDAGLTPEKDKSAVGGTSEGSLISPIDKNISIDENDMEILNKLPDNAFENLFTDKNGDLELTEEEQNLILGVGNEDAAALLPDGDELPDEITDVILHAESEQQRNAVSFDSMYKGGPPAYNEHRTLYDQRQEFMTDFHNRPPPEYPGTPNKHLSVSIPSTVHHNYSIEHYHKHQQMIHQPVMQSTSLQSPPIMHPTNYPLSPRHPPPQNFPLPPTASLLDSGHTTSGRLPSVASIHRGVWQDQNIYQNGFHPDHYNTGMYSPGTMASPPIYHPPSTPNQMYPPNAYTNAPFPINHPQTPHNHIHMPLQ